MNISQYFLIIYFWDNFPLIKKVLTAKIYFGGQFRNSIISYYLPFVSASGRGNESKTLSPRADLSLGKSLVLP